MGPAHVVGRATYRTLEQVADAFLQDVVRRASRYSQISGLANMLNFFRIWSGAGLRRTRPKGSPIVARRQGDDLILRRSNADHRDVSEDVRAPRLAP